MAVDRRAAKAEYKKRKSCAGIYAIRCTPTGNVWVGQAPNLETIATREQFSLRQGGHPHAGLQSAWAKHGADSFVFETLEQLEDEDLPYLRQAALKERLAYWCAALGATRI